MSRTHSMRIASLGAKVLTSGPGGARLCRSMAAGSLAMAVVLAFTPLADAATANYAWQAKIGRSGVNGTAALNLYVTGTGSITLKLAKLKPSATLAVAVIKASCS